MNNDIKETNDYCFELKDYITNLQKENERLTQELNKTQNKYIEVANKLFDSIEDKGKVKELLNNEKNI